MVPRLTAPFREGFGSKIGMINIWKFIRMPQNKVWRLERQVKDSIFQLLSYGMTDEWINSNHVGISIVSPV